MEENWYNVKDFEGYYQVSDLGRIRRVRPTVNCGIEEIRILSLGESRKGEPCIILMKPNFKRAFVPKNLIYDTVFPEYSGQKFKFKDETKAIFKEDNIVHCAQIRRQPTSAKLTTKKVLKLRDLGFTVNEIANQLGFTAESVGQHSRKAEDYVNQRKIWKIKVLAKSGKSIEEIAKRKSLPEKVVSEMLNKASKIKD